MASLNVTQSPDAFTLESVLQSIEERDSQMYALASSLLHWLSPADEKNLPDDFPITAWRLAQLLDDALSSSKILKSARDRLLPGTESLCL